MFCHHTRHVFLLDVWAVVIKTGSKWCFAFTYVLFVAVLTIHKVNDPVWLAVDTMEDFMTFSCGTRVEGPGASDEVAIVLSFSPAWVSFVPDRLLGFVASDIKLMVVSSNNFSLSPSSGLYSSVCLSHRWNRLSLGWFLLSKVNMINFPSYVRSSFIDLFDRLFQLFLRVTASFKKCLVFLCSSPEIFIIGTDSLNSCKLAVGNGVFGVYWMATGFI